MLVLSRHEQEEIVIGHNIVVTILRIAGGAVRVGVSAPKDVSVHRREIEDQIKRERMMAR